MLIEKPTMAFILRNARALLERGRSRWWTVTFGLQISPVASAGTGAVESIIQGIAPNSFADRDEKKIDALSRKGT